ncbi:MAG: glycosyltransferase [Aeromicrobium sp.]
MPATLPSWLIDLAEARIVTPAAVARLALRHDLVGTEELLAYLASAGTTDYAGIIDLARAYDAQTKPEGAAFASLTSPGLFAMAFVAIGTPGGDPARAADLFALARGVARRTGAQNQHADLDLQTSLRAGRTEDVRAQLASRQAYSWVDWAVSADLINPFAGDHEIAKWLDVFNEPFVERGLARIEVGDPARPFDSLTTSDARAATVDGPLVSIIVSVFKPTDSLLAAVRSLVAQTWSNLQVVIVDDASPDEYTAVLDQARALDPRVEYVRMPANGGAYRARNFGITQARGEFVGFQDGDDWSHPERIERQMRAFADTSVLATMSKAIWLHDDLLITVPGEKPYTKIAPSLILRREPAMTTLGPFDDVRRGADTEYIERLTTVFGAAALVMVDEPLSLYQLTHGSLSRGDFRLGWRRNSRISYHSAFRHWHEQIREHGVAPLAVTEQGRAYPAPPEIAGTDYPSTPLDVVVLADVRTGVVERTGLPAELEALAAAGLQVGLARSEAMRNAAVARTYPDESIQRVIASGAATWRPLSAELAPRVLLVRDPDLLAFLRAEGSVLMRPERLLVVADRMPRPDETPRVSYDPAHIELVGQSTFGCHVEWLPASAQISAALARAGASGMRHPPHRMEVCDVRPFPARLLEERPVIGVDDSARFGAERADRQLLNRLLPKANAYDIRVLESSARPADPQTGSLSFDPALLTPTEFFEQCDFVVGLPTPVHGIGLTRPLLTAMSRGCVPLAHPSQRDVLGDAAVYYGDRTIQQLVDDLWQDSERFAAAQRAAVTFCHNEFSAEAFAGAFMQITGSEPT